MKLKYAVVIEKSEKNYAAYVPDIPGCVATAETKLGVAKNIRAAINMHLQALAEQGLPIPQPTTDCQYVEALSP